MSAPEEARQLPEALQRFAVRYPGVWKAYADLGDSCAEAGPLDKKSQRIAKLGLAIGSGRQGAVHSHTRRALAAGCTPEEILHVGILGVTTLGWPAAFAAICWINDILEKRKS